MLRIARIAAALCLLAAVGTLDAQEFGHQTWQAENGLPQNTVHAILQTRDGFLWVGTEGGLARFDGIQFAVYSTQNTPALRSNHIRSLAESPDGSLWITTAAGVTRFTHGQFINSGAGQPDATRDDTPDSFKNSTAKTLGLNLNKINALYRDRTGTLWVGTETGLARVIGGRAAPLEPADSFSGQTILAITQDREGDLWVGTESNGLGILRPEKFTTFTKQDGLGDDWVRCVLEDRSGAVWIGTDSGGLTRYRNGKFTSFTTRDGLTSNVILALAEDTDGTLLIGTPDGLNRFHDRVLPAITSADGLPDDFIRSIAPGNGGSLWIGTRRGLVRLTSGKVATFTAKEGLGSDLVGTVLPDSEGNLWIATLGGLTRFQNGKFTNYTTQNGLSNNTITALYLDATGNLWIGAEGGGLNVLANGRFTAFPQTLELPSSIYGIAEDDDRNLWMSSNSGIDCVSRDELMRFARGESKTVNVIPYGTSDGLRISESSGGGHPSISLAKNGALWFATLKGLALVHDPRRQRNPLPPPVVIESIGIDDRSFAPGELASIPPGHSRFAFEYAGLGFIAPHKVRFRYKLEGFDRDWVDAGQRRVAYYTNLRPKNYVFRVIARNNDGVWNESGASLRFRVEPHFYETYWFSALIVAVLAFMGYWIYRWRVKQVEAQFSAVLQERNRIAREIHDTLAQGFTGISVQLELVSRLLNSSVDAAREHLDQARVLVRNSLAEARTSIWALRSQSDENEDFAARISKMAAQAAQPGAAKVSLHVHGAYRPISPKVEQELLKIAQEAVRNAARHAEAGHIAIELAFDAKRLRMTIADDGRGFTHAVNSSGVDGHFGLRGMRERAAEIDADLNVESAAGKGTKISVEAALH